MQAKAAKNVHKRIQQRKTRSYLHKWKFSLYIRRKLDILHSRFQGQSLYKFFILLQQCIPSVSKMDHCGQRVICDNLDLFRRKNWFHLHVLNRSKTSILRKSSNEWKLVFLRRQRFQSIGDETARRLRTRSASHAFGLWQLYCRSKCEMRRAKRRVHKLSQRRILHWSLHVWISVFVMTVQYSENLARRKIFARMQKMAACFQNWKLNPTVVCLLYDAVNHYLINSNFRIQCFVLQSWRQERQRANDTWNAFRKIEFSLQMRRLAVCFQHMKYSIKFEQLYRLTKTIVGFFQQKRLKYIFVDLWKSAVNNLFHLQDSPITGILDKWSVLLVSLKSKTRKRIYRRCFCSYQSVLNLAEKKNRISQIRVLLDISKQVPGEKPVRSLFLPINLLNILSEFNHGITSVFIFHIRKAQVMVMSIVFVIWRKHVVLFRFANCSFQRSHQNHDWKTVSFSLVFWKSRTIQASKFHKMTRILCDKHQCTVKTHYFLQWNHVHKQILSLGEFRLKDKHLDRHLLQKEFLMWKKGVAAFAVRRMSCLMRKTFIFRNQHLLAHKFNILKILSASARDYRCNNYFQMSTQFLKIFSHNYSRTSSGIKVWNRYTWWQRRKQKVFMALAFRAKKHSIKMIILAWRARMDRKLHLVKTREFARDVHSKHVLKEVFLIWTNFTINCITIISQMTTVKDLKLIATFLRVWEEFSTRLGYILFFWHNFSMQLRKRKLQFLRQLEAENSLTRDNWLRAMKFSLSRVESRALVMQTAAITCAGLQQLMNKKNLNLKKLVFNSLVHFLDLNKQQIQSSVFCKRNPMYVLHHVFSVWEILVTRRKSLLNRCTRALMYRHYGLLEICFRKLFDGAVEAKIRQSCR